MIEELREWLAGVIAVVLFAVILGYLYDWGVSTISPDSPWAGVLHSVSEMSAAALVLVGGGFIGAIAIVLRLLRDSFGGR